MPVYFQTMQAKKKNAKKICKQSLTLGHSPSEIAKGVTSKAEGLNKKRITR